MTASVFLGFKVDWAHKSFNTILVVGSAGEMGSTKDHVSHFVITISDSVGESRHPHTNSFQYTITCKLVHNQWTFSFQWFFVCVWYNATDEMRFSDVQGSH